MKNNTITSTTPVYTLSTAANLSGIPTHSIRQYIDKGLIIPYKKDSKRNLFSEVDLKRLNYINKLLNEDGLNIAGIRALLSLIPCWKISNCSKIIRKDCKAYIKDDAPCWDASNKGTECKNKDCRECMVYKVVENHNNLKAYMKILVS